jgi:hypothetical protein
MVPFPILFSIGQAKKILGKNGPPSYCFCFVFSVGWLKKNFGKKMVFWVLFNYFPQPIS